MISNTSRAGCVGNNWQKMREKQMIWKFLPTLWYSQRDNNVAAWTDSHILSSKFSQLPKRYTEVNPPILKFPIKRTCSLERVTVNSPLSYQKESHCLYSRSIILMIYPGLTLWIQFYVKGKHNKSKFSVNHRNQSSINFSQNATSEEVDIKVRQVLNSQCQEMTKKESDNERIN